MSGAAEIAARLLLRAVPMRREWRGNCPSCGYAATMVLAEKDGRALWWCASCRDREAVTAAVRRVMGGEWKPPSTAASRCVPSASTVGEQAARALALWDEALPLPRSPAARYLAARAIPDVVSAALGFHPRAPHPGGGPRLPALVAAVRDPRSGELRAVHRTYLRPDGTGKAAVEPAKASLGPVAGGAVMLDAPHGDAPLVVAEGLENALSAGRLLGAPAWSAVSAGNLEKHLALPAAVPAVIIAADPDEVGQRAAWQAARRWRAEGRHVRVATPDDPDTDFNDLIARRGVAAAEVRHGAC